MQAFSVVSFGIGEVQPVVVDARIQTYGERFTEIEGFVFVSMYFDDINWYVITLFLLSYFSCAITPRLQDVLSFADWWVVPNQFSRLCKSKRFLESILRLGRRGWRLWKKVSICLSINLYHGDLSQISHMSVMAFQDHRLFECLLKTFIIAMCLFWRLS